jgi:hypothetical protein
LSDARAMSNRRNRRNSRTSAELRRSRNRTRSGLATAAVLFVAGFASATSGAKPANHASPKAQPASAKSVKTHAAAQSLSTSFESMKSGWYGFGSATHVARSNIVAKRGEYSLRARIMPRTAAGGAAFDAGGRGVPVLPGTKYTIAAWIRGRGTLEMSVGFHNAGRHALRSPSFAGTGTSFVPKRSTWHRYEIHFTSPADARSLVLKIGGSRRQKSTFFIDAVSVTASPAGNANGASATKPSPPKTGAATTTTTATSTTTPAPAPTTTRGKSPAAPSHAPPPAATTTQTTSTTPTTTTAATTTTTTTATPPPPAPSPSRTYADAIAYTSTRPSFTVVREVDVASQSQLQSAIANIKAGDLVKATTGFLVSGEFQISANPSGPAEIDLGTGSSAVQFSYGGSSDLPSVWIVNSSNLRIFGGEIHGPPPGQVGNGGVTIYHSTNVLWWHFHIHDVAGIGLSLAPVSGPISGCDFEGEVDHWGENTSYDPHAEKGTGVHAANVADVGGAVYTNNRLALYAHDGPTGAAIQIGNPDGSGQISGDTIILKAVNLTMRATSQVAGNALQAWGGVAMQIAVPYLEATNLQGRAVDTNGVYSGVSESGIRVDYGRATNTNLNSALATTESSVSPTTPWDPRHGPSYQDVR